MREVKYTTRFQRDYRREKSSRHGKKLDAQLMEAVNLLAADTPLPRRNFDQPLSGEWNDHRDCQIRPDLVLICRDETPWRVLDANDGKMMESDAQQSQVGRRKRLPHHPHHL
jgi:mRNA interferase YafQ